MIKVGSLESFASWGIINFSELIRSFLRQGIRFRPPPTFSFHTFCTAKHARENHNQISITSSVHLPKARWKRPIVVETKQLEARSENKQLIFRSGKVFRAILSTTRLVFNSKLQELFTAAISYLLRCCSSLYINMTLSRYPNVTKRISKFSCECYSYHKSTIVDRKKKKRGPKGFRVTSHWTDVDDDALDGIAVFVVWLISNTDVAHWCLMRQTASISRPSETHLLH